MGFYVSERELFVTLSLKVFENFWAYISGHSVFFSENVGYFSFSLSEITSTTIVLYLMHSFFCAGKKEEEKTLSKIHNPSNYS